MKTRNLAEASGSSRKICTGSPARPLTRTDIVLMAIACAFAVATLYYNQPLLPQMGASFDRTGAQSGLIATMTQLGYAGGLFLFVPLGDRLDRKRLILSLLTANMLSLGAVALAPGFTLLAVASFAVGLSAVTAQVVIPAVTGLAPAAERGRVVGALLSGLSAGLLFARTLSGVIGAHGGWRAMFGLAILFDLALMAIIWRRLPATARTSTLSYPALLASLWPLVRREPVLRAAAVTGFLMFAAFSALWSTLAALLALPPYGFGPDLAGALGFVGVAGVTASPLIGQAVDRFGPRPVLTAGAGAVLAAFAIILTAGQFLAPVIVALVLVDIGNRAGLVANQSRIYALSAEARSRLNTLFMTSYFLGGASGAAVAAVVTARLHWLGLGLTGGGFTLAALIWHWLSGRAPNRNSR